MGAFGSNLIAAEKQFSRGRLPYMMGASLFCRIGPHLKLSQRLQQIDRMITEQYDAVWDCCCDHGQLGMSLLGRNAADRVHFVDCVEALTSALETRLVDLTSRGVVENIWQVHCMDVSKILLPDDGSRHLLIIAGVGGDLIIDMVRAIRALNPDRELEFLLCPVYHQYKVRTALDASGFGLIGESLVKENNQFYEVLHVSDGAERSISPVGSMMWDLSQDDHKEYLGIKLAHYERASKRDASAKNLVDQYRAVHQRQV